MQNVRVCMCRNVFGFANGHKPNSMDLWFIDPLYGFHLGGMTIPNIIKIPVTYWAWNILCVFLFLGIFSTWKTRSFPHKTEGHFIRFHTSCWSSSNFSLPTLHLSQFLRSESKAEIPVFVALTMVLWPCHLKSLSGDHYLTVGGWRNPAGGFHGGFTGVFSESRSLFLMPQCLCHHFCAWSPFRQIEWFIHAH